jgi:hypothetical protein
MGSANKVPICFAGYDASDLRRVVPVSGLTGFAITSLRSHNLMEPIDRLELFPASGSHLFATLRLRCKDWGMASLIRLPAGHDRPDDAGHFVRHGHARHARWLPGKQREKARIRRLGLMPGSADQTGRANHQELSQIPVTHLGDAAEPVLTAARVLRGCEPQPGGKLSTRTELCRIGDRCRRCRCTDRACREWSIDAVQPRQFFARQGSKRPRALQGSFRNRGLIGSALFAVHDRGKTKGPAPTRRT